MIVAAGDTPLLEGESLRAFAAEHEAAQRAVSILTGLVANPFGYGRIVRTSEGDVEAIVEEKDASDEQRLIREINSGILAFDVEFLLDALPQIGNDNAKGEYYLTDAVQIARDAGLTVGAHSIDDVMQTEGANDRVQLAELGRELNRRIVDAVDARRRDRHGPGHHLDRRRRRARPGRHDPARHPAARRHGRRRGRRRSGPTRRSRTARSAREPASYAPMPSWP